MYSGFPEITKDQSVTSPSGEALGKYSHVKHYESNSKLAHRFDPVLEAARELNSVYGASFVYIIQYGGKDSNVYIYNILYLLGYWNTQYCMDVTSIVNMRSSYYIKSHIQNPDTPMYMEALSGESVEYYYKSVGEKSRVF